MVAVLNKINHKSVAVDAGLLSEAKAHGLDVTGISEAALREAIGKAKAAKDWADENAEAIAERTKRVKAKGTLLSDVQVLQLD